MKQTGGRKRILTVVTSIFLLAGLVFGGYLLYKYKYKADDIPPELDTNNLIPNGGFEGDMSSWWPPGGIDVIGKWDIDTNEHHNGSKSLKAVNTDETCSESDCQFSSERIFVGKDISNKIQPNVSYRISGWIKTGLDVLIPPELDKGVSIMLVTNNSDPTKNDAIYPSMLKTSNTDWTYFEASTSILDTTTWVQLVLGVGKYNGVGATGTIWFDDIEIEEVMSSTLRYPNYRGTIYSGMDKKLTIRTNGIKDTFTYPLNDTVIQTTIKDNGGITVSGPTIKTVTETKVWEDTDINLNALSLPPGEYTVTVEIKGADIPFIRKTDVLPFTISGETLPKVYFDENGRTMVDGQPYFPRGFYTDNTLSEAGMQKITDAKFNTIMQYKVSSVDGGVPNYLNLLNSHGLKLIYDLNQRNNIDPGVNDNDFYDDPDTFPGQQPEFTSMKTFFDTYKDAAAYPAILAWYLNDERSTREPLYNGVEKNWLPQILEHYNHVKTDKNHPIYQVLMPSQDPLLALPTTDVIGTDPYPISEAKLGTPNMTYTGTSTKSLQTASKSSYPMWMVGESTSFWKFQGKSDCRAPSFDEMVVGAYQNFIYGARGLILFDYYDIFDSSFENNNPPNYWENTVAKVGIELNNIESIVLGIDTTAVTSNNSNIDILTRQVTSEVENLTTEAGYYALADNATGASIATEFTIPTELGEIGSVSVKIPGQTDPVPIAVTGNKFSDTIEALGARIYKFNTLVTPPPITETKPDTPSVSSLRSFTYKDKITISGTKSSNATKVLVNGAEAVLSGNNWSKEVPLGLNKSNTFSVIAENEAGQSGAGTIDIYRRKPADANADGIINKLDFSSLMFNWNKTEPNNPADFNEDSAVNKLDFAALMFNWGK